MNKNFMKYSLLLFFIFPFSVFKLPSIFKKKDTENLTYFLNFLKLIIIFM
jgi:hypothetical protein